MEGNKRKKEVKTNGLDYYTYGRLNLYFTTCQLLLSILVPCRVIQNRYKDYYRPTYRTNLRFVEHNWIFSTICVMRQIHRQSKLYGLNIILNAFSLFLRYLFISMLFFSELARRLIIDLTCFVHFTHILLSCTHTYA